MGMVKKWILGKGSVFIDSRRRRKEFAAVWNDLIPLKVSVLVWRLMQNRISSKDNLIKRGALNESQKFCSFGCRVEKRKMFHTYFLNVR